MCGRFAQARSSEELASIFRARAAAQLPGETFNVAPTDVVSAVHERHGERIVDAFRWGLVPGWASGPRDAARRINARAETIEASPTFRSAFRTRRCIVPADAFYEWRRERPAAGHGQGRAWPFAIQRADGTPLALAGLWAAWRDPGNATRIHTMSIVTTVPNELVASVHDRMPVILDPDDWDAWLAEDSPATVLRPLLLPLPADRLRMRPVSPEVNSVRSEGPQLLARWEPHDASTQLPLT